MGGLRRPMGLPQRLTCTSAGSADGIASPPESSPRLHTTAYSSAVTSNAQHTSPATLHEEEPGLARPKWRRSQLRRASVSAPPPSRAAPAAAATRATRRHDVMMS